MRPLVRNSRFSERRLRCRSASRRSLTYFRDCSEPVIFTKSALSSVDACPAMPSQAMT